METSGSQQCNQVHSTELHVYAKQTGQLAQETIAPSEHKYNKMITHWHK